MEAGIVPSRHRSEGPSREKYSRRFVDAQWRGDERSHCPICGRRPRSDRSAPKLLLHKTKFRNGLAAPNQGLTVIPLRIYFRDGIAKCEIALAQGKKVWDRRQDERNKEARREAETAMYRNRRR